MAHSSMLTRREGEKMLSASREIRRFRDSIKKMQICDAGKVLGAVLLMLRCTLPHPNMEMLVERASTGIVLSSIGYTTEKGEREKYDGQIN
jgi:hypothetical protein